MELKVFDVSGQPVGQLALRAELWAGPVSTGVLSQALAMYRTNQRAGLASTKTRGDVSGGGKKPWKQKHTGRARAGSIRSPLWRHGGAIFGPHPRDVSYRLPQAIRRRALLESLKGKLRDDEVVLLDGVQAQSPKTKPFARLASAFGVKSRSLIVLEQPTQTLIKSLRNLQGFDLRAAASLSAFDVLNAHKVLVTTPAWARLEERVQSRDATSH